MTLNTNDIIDILLIIVCLCSIYGLFELVRVLIGIRKMITRLDYITDISSWFDLIKVFRKKKKV